MVDTLLYDWSIPVISTLQDKLSEQANYMSLISVLFDPKYAFLIYSPLAYLLDHKVGRKLILTTVIAEWLNQILKWFLHGERPYWYVHSSGHFDPQQVPIKQFPITCELGPGHPSGHAMVTAAVWYIILDSLLQASIVQQQQQQINSISSTKQEQRSSLLSSSSSLSLALASSSRQAFKVSVWTLYALMLATVSVSRVFLGCHFPHQCLAGAILGLMLAKWVSGLETKALHFIGTSVFVLVTAFGTFGLLQTLGFDPSWTIKLATTHCVKREYIHLDTAPFFSIMRYSGFALGCGLGIMFPLRNYFKQLVPIGETEGEIILDSSGKMGKSFSSRKMSWFSIKILMALLMARLVDNLGLFVSHADLSIFYTAAFLAYTLFSFAFINL